MHTRKQLEDKVSPDDFKTFALGQCSSSSIKNASTVCDMFHALACEKKWNYKDHTCLKDMLMELKITDDETKKKFDDYTQSLHAYCVTVRIMDLMKIKKLDKNHLTSTQHLPSHDCTKLSVKLDPFEVIDKTLQDVKNLWESFVKGLLRLPKLDAVLHSIEEGCLLVTWFISPNDEELEYLIRKRVSCSEIFFKRHNIVQFMLNDECIYQEQVHTHVHVNSTCKVHMYMLYVTKRSRTVLRVA